MKRAISAILGSLLLMVFSVLGFSGCDEKSAYERKILVPPTPEALQAAKQLKQQLPDVRITFSQNTGGILWISGSSTSPLLFSYLPLINEDSAMKRINSFLEKHPYLFEIIDPANEIRIATKGVRTYNDNSTHLTMVRFEQVINGVPLLNKGGVAIFNQIGALVSLTASLERSQDLLVADTTQSTSQPLEIDSAGRTYQIKTQKFFVKLGGQAYELLQESVKQEQFSKIRTIYDSQGKVLWTLDETASNIVKPSDGWETTGQATSEWAHDSQDVLQKIHSTRMDSSLILGFELPGVLRPGQTVRIGDSGPLTDRSLVNRTPIATDAPTWVQEDFYEQYLRDATTLANNIEITLRWFKDNLSHLSWDGKGSGVDASVRGNRRKDGQEDFNAYGGYGFILVGDGHTASGHPITDAVEIVAHELTHSLIYNYAFLFYQAETGAIMEGIADIFGLSVANFKNHSIGKDIGMNARDVVNPEGPSSYSEWINYPMDYDNGGTHMNAGIVSRALALAIYKNDLKNSPDPVPVLRLVIDGLRDIPVPPRMTIEEFAANFSAYCQARQLGDVCDHLDLAFANTEVLRFTTLP